MKEEDIRPSEIFVEYLRLAEIDAQLYFSDVERVSGVCPACCREGDFVFEKHSFTYELCQSCQTLFVNPRPIADAFSRYYTESASSKFWASTFYEKTAEVRREKLWKPKAQMILGILQDHSVPDCTIVDIGGGVGLFADVIREFSSKTPVVIEPGPQLAAACRSRSLPVIEKFLEDVLPQDLPIGPKAFVSFELFEHLHDPYSFLSQVSDLMSPVDVFIFTTLSSTGVDVQALWDNSKSVTPPHHINFFNPKSISLLLDRAGFDNISVTTPGRLDLDILFNNKSLIRDRFWRTFIYLSSTEDRHRWQELVASSGWSSHMMVVCRKSSSRATS